MAVFMSRTFEVPELYVSVTITGTGGTSSQYAVIGDVQYTSAATGIQARKGSTITLVLYKANASNGNTITVDGTTVVDLYQSGEQSGSYSLIVSKDMSSIKIAFTSIGSAN